MPLEPGAPVGTYRTVAPLGAGAMGEAVRARGFWLDGARVSVAGRERVSSRVLREGVDGLGPSK
jgi:hypothetical protein